MMIFDRHWLTLIIDLHFSTMINMLGNASWNISSISSLAASRQALWRWSSSAAPRWKHSQNWSMRTMRHHGTIQDGGMLETGYQGELTHTHMLSHVVSFVGALWIGSQRYGNASRCGISVACRSFRYPRHQVCRLGDAFAVCFSLPGWADNVSVVSVRFCFLLQQVSFPSREIHSHGSCFFSAREDSKSTLRVVSQFALYSALYNVHWVWSLPRFAWAVPFQVLHLVCEMVSRENFSNSWRILARPGWVFDNSKTQSACVAGNHGKNGTKLYFRSAWFSLLSKISGNQPQINHKPDPARKCLQMATLMEGLTSTHLGAVMVCVAQKIGRTRSQKYPKTMNLSQNPEWLLRDLLKMIFSRSKQIDQDHC